MLIEFVAKHAVSPTHSIYSITQLHLVCGPLDLSAEYTDSVELLELLEFLG
jgi:hypothetical protein